MEVDNYAFNYTGTVDTCAFERMKTEQSLEICFEELQAQLVNLLQEVQQEQM